MNASLAGKIGALRLHALYDSTALTKNARAVAATKLDQRLLSEIRAKRPGISAEDEAVALKRMRSAYFSALGARPKKVRS